jgi:hypothetical protein
MEKELKGAVDPTGTLSDDFDPEEFNRKLKESVEAGPPQRRIETEELPAAGSGDGGGAAAPPSEPPPSHPRPGEPRE